jgi:glycosyltransferase involved in cell wall biosynthesis
MGNETKIVTFQSARAESNIESVPLLTVNKTAFSFDSEALSKLIRMQNPDIINWHCSDLWSSFNLWRLRNKINSRIVWTLHSGILSFEDLKTLKPLDILQLYKFWNNIFNAAIPKRIINKWLDTDALAHIVTLSNRTAKRLNGFGVPEEMVTCITSGVDVDVFRSLNTAEDCPRILYFGPLDRLRGIDILLSAFEHVKQEVPLARLTLLARESHHNKVWKRRISRLGSVDLVTGILEQREIVEKLDSASIVALPFRFWPQVDCPLTVLEAMAMRKPTISTSIGAIPEIISNGETGFLVPAKDPMQLAKLIIELLTNKPLSERIGRNARARTENFHDWNIITKRTLEVLANASN